MAKPNVAQIPAKLYELLEPLSAEERTRVVQATMILFGDAVPASPGAPAAPAAPDTPAGQPAGSNTHQDYLDQKDPKNKGEVLAVAARYREMYQDSHTHTKADLKKVITDSRRNFDDSNFARDINNAKRQAGFFNTGTGRDSSKLSYYGQQFVDALPDRDKAGKIKRPKVGGAKKKSAKKKSTKK